MAFEDWLPIRAIRGFIGGIGHGFRGQMDTNTRFSDGVWTNNPEQMSAAGRFLSQYAGVRGGYTTGEKVGKWGAAAAGAYYSLGLAIGIGGAIGGFFPIIAGAVMVGVATWLSANVGAVVGRTVGSVIGGVVGAVGGAVVGTFNAIFKRGYYKDPAAELPMEAPGVEQVIDAPEQGADVGLPGQELGQAEGMEQETAPGMALGPQQAADHVPKRGVGKWLGIGAAALGGSMLLHKLGQRYANAKQQAVVHDSEILNEPGVFLKDFEDASPPEPAVDDLQQTVEADAVQAEQHAAEMPDPVGEFRAHQDPNALADAMDAVNQARTQGGLMDGGFSHGEGEAPAQDETMVERVESARAREAESPSARR